MARSTFSLIGERYLDTELDERDIHYLEQELRQRGVVGWRRWWREYLAATGLWWNVFWWEWQELNEDHIQYGWRLNFGVIGIPCLFIGLMTVLWWGLALFIVALCFCTWCGLGLRAEANGS